MALVEGRSAPRKESRVILRLAARNLLHEPSRSAVALSGVAFAVLLVTLQAGILVGSAENASTVVDHSRADLWIASPEVRNFDFGRPIPEARWLQALGTPGVARAERMIVAYADWKDSRGRIEKILLVGIEPGAQLSGPWEMAGGDLGGLRLEGGVVIDERERTRFGDRGPLALGDRGEINERAARVVGFSRGVGSMTTIPYVFASLRTATEFSSLYAPGDVSYVLVRGEPGVDRRALADRLGELPDVEVLPAEAFSRRSRGYWVFGTGLGIGWCMTAILGLGVGTVVLSQTIYTLTFEKRSEFATLKSIGWSARALGGVVLAQAGILGAIGYALGVGASRVVLEWIPPAVSIRLSTGLAAAVLALTGLVALASAANSVWRLARLEPAEVFHS